MNQRLPSLESLLDDDNPELRIEAARILRDLADDPSALARASKVLAELEKQYAPRTRA